MENVGYLFFYINRETNTGENIKFY